MRFYNCCIMDINYYHINSYDLESKLEICLVSNMSSRLSIDERVKIIELFVSCQSIVETQRKFRTCYNKKNAPTRKSIERIVAKFKQNGSVKNQQASGRPRSVCIPDNYDKVEASVDEDPRLSVRERAGHNLLE